MIASITASARVVARTAFRSNAVVAPRAFNVRMMNAVRFASSEFPLLFSHLGHARVLSCPDADQNPCRSRSNSIHNRPRIRPARRLHQHRYRRYHRLRPESPWRRRICRIAPGRQRSHTSWYVSYSIPVILGEPLIDLYWFRPHRSRRIREGRIGYLCPCFGRCDGDQ